jgi:hypothetical protein
MEKYTINIAVDFSANLGGRKKDLGSFSGEEFFENILEKKYVEAQNHGEPLHIYLDGATPYGSGFLDQSFGELYRKYGEKTRENIVFHTEFFQWIVDYINTEIWKQK